MREAERLFGPSGSELPRVADPLVHEAENGLSDAKEKRRRQLRHIAERFLYHGNRIHELLDSSELNEESTHNLIKAVNESIECLTELFVKELCEQGLGGKELGEACRKAGLEAAFYGPRSSGAAVLGTTKIDARSAYPACLSALSANAAYGKDGPRDGTEERVNEPSSNVITHKLFENASKAIVSVISAGDYTTVKVSFEKPVTLKDHGLFVIDEETQSIPTPNRLLDYLPCNTFGNLRLVATINEASVYFTVDKAVKIHEEKPYARTPQDREGTFHRLPSWHNLFDICSLPWEGGAHLSVSLSFDNQVIDMSAGALIKNRVALGGELDSLGVEPNPPGRRSPGLELMQQGFDEYMARQNKTGD
jgi:hypothetical protein